VNDFADYPIVIFRTPSDGLYVAEVPDLAGCNAHGETPEEALREVQIAMGLWLEVAREIGLPIPEPSAYPALRAVG
jgi:predicted RNase H-like HicB family nuclease